MRFPRCVQFIHTEAGGEKTDGAAVVVAAAHLHLPGNILEEKKTTKKRSPGSQKRETRVRVLQILKARLLADHSGQRK